MEPCSSPLPWLRRKMLNVYSHLGGEKDGLQDGATWESGRLLSFQSLFKRSTPELSEIWPPTRESDFRVCGGETNRMQAQYEFSERPLTRPPGVFDRHSVRREYGDRIGLEARSL